MNIKKITYLDMKKIQKILHDMYWINENCNNPGKYIYDNCKKILNIINKYNIYKEQEK